MKIALGCDHGGYAMKEDIKKQLEGLGHEVKDCGTYSTESCDYPIFGEAAARAVASGECEYLPLHRVLGRPPRPPRRADGRYRGLKHTKAENQQKPKGFC